MRRNAWLIVELLIFGQSPVLIDGVEQPPNFRRLGQRGHMLSLRFFRTAFSEEQGAYSAFPVAIA
jgi:hypothetical protein